MHHRKSCKLCAFSDQQHLTLLSIYQMEVESSRKCIDHRTGGQFEALLQPTSDVQVDRQLVLSGSRIEAAEDRSEPEVEEPTESAGNLISNHGELDTIDEQSIESNIDDDATHDTAAAVRIDLLSLQRKVLRFAVSIAMSSQGQLSAKSSSQRTAFEERPAGQSTPQLMSSTAEEPANSTSQVDGRSSPVILTDPSGGKWVLPYERCKERVVC